MSESETESKPKKPIYKKWWLWLIVVVVVAGIAGIQDDDSDETTTSGGVKVADSPVILQRPDQQKNFILITQKTRQDGKNADNDMQRGGFLATRSKEICKLLNPRAVNNWTGWVSSVDSNAEGKGVLIVKLARDIHVQTWNNDLSDIGNETLIEPGTKVSNTASAMKSGQKVKFSGTFISDDTHCIQEQSMSLSGKIDDPEFTFRFSAIEALD